MPEFKKAGQLSELPPDSMKAVEIGLDRILLCRSGDTVYALADECSHDSAPISDGFFKRNEVICPRHGARFDITTGNPTRPPAVAPIDTYEVKIEGDEILVYL